MYNKFLLLSFEASDYEPSKAVLQQVTLTVAEREQNKLTILKETSFFLDAHDLGDLFDTLQGIPLAEDPSYRGFSTKDIKRYAKEEGITLIQKVIDYVDCIITPNNSAEYHIPILQKEGISFRNKIIIDIVQHITYPKKIKSKKFLHLCAEHNFLPFVGEPRLRTVSINRAMLTLINLYDLNETLKASLAEKKNCIKLMAVINYSQNEEAKKLGFKFNFDTKQWYQWVSEERYLELLGIMGQEYLEILEKRQ